GRILRVFAVDLFQQFDDFLQGVNGLLGRFGVVIFLGLTQVTKGEAGLGVSVIGGVLFFGQLGKGVIVITDRVRNAIFLPGQAIRCLKIQSGLTDLLGLGSVLFQ